MIVFRKRTLAALLLAFCLSLCAAAPSYAGAASAAEENQISATATPKGADAKSATPTTPATTDTDATTKDKGVGSATPATPPFVASTMAVAMDRFGDVSPNSVLGGEVIIAAARGLVKGYADGNFHPNDPVSVRAFLTMLLRSFDSAGCTPALATESEWGDAVSLLMERVMREVDLDAACNFIKTATKPATRGDAIHLMALMSGANQRDYEGRSMTPFEDLSLEEQAWADMVNGSRSDRPVITGYRDNTARFDQVLTRAEAAALLNRLTDRRVAQMVEDSPVGVVYKVERIPLDRTFGNVHDELVGNSSSWRMPKMLATAGLYLFGSGYETNLCTIGTEEVVCAAMSGAANDSCFVFLRLDRLGKAELITPAAQTTFATPKHFVTWVDKVTEPYEVVSEFTKDGLGAKTREDLRHYLEKPGWEDVLLGDVARYAVSCGLHDVEMTKTRNGDGTYTERLSGVIRSTEIVFTKGYPYLGEASEVFFCLYALNGGMDNTAPEQLETPSDGAKIIELLCKVE